LWSHCLVHLLDLQDEEESRKGWVRKDTRDKERKDKNREKHREETEDKWTRNT
jgi:hypothetical protein